MRGAGTESRFVRIGEESRTCIAIMDRKNGTSTEILEPGPTIAEAEQRSFLSLFAGLLERADVVASSGSPPRGLPPEFYRTLAGMAKQRGRPFILDMSGDALLLSLEGRPFMVKPNQMERLTGHTLAGPREQAEAVLALARRGIGLPCLTLGADGAWAFIDGTLYRFTAPPIEVLNTVGSGGAFVAGCAVGLRRGYGHLESVRHGMACAMANTQFFETGMVSVELVERFLGMVRVERAECG